MLSKEFLTLVRENSEQAVEVVVRCMNDEQASWRDRTAAAGLIISYAHGKPVDRLAVTSMDESQRSSGSRPSMSELMARVEGYMERQEALEGEAVETPHDAQPD